LKEIEMERIEVIYEKGVLRIVKPAKIESDIVTVKILNRDEILTVEDMEDILEATNEREKGNYYRIDEVVK
jgi:predicted DNA-binding antitoxin AbrB/MazE fold protein